MYLTLHEDERDNSYTTMKYLERLFDTLIDRIVIFTDYFIVHKKITLSETFLFVFSICWAIWLALFAAESTYNRIWTSGVWSIIFSVTSLAHFATFFYSPKARAFTVSLHAFVWCFLAILAMHSGTTSTAIPSLWMLSMLCVFVAVRLFHENAD